jgi:hypothetical protein
MNRTAPLPPLRPTRTRKLWAFVLAAVALLAGLAFLIWYMAFRQEIPHYDDPEVHYKYGSIGNESYEGIPYWIWLALPQVFSDHLPGGEGGYAAFGMYWEEAGTKPDGSFKPGGGPPPTDGQVGYSVPVGFSVANVGTIPMVAMNCAQCHTSAVRRPGDVSPTLFPGGPSHQLDPQGYLRFLFKCAHDARFDADHLMEKIQYNVKLNPLEKLIYRYVVIPRTKAGLLDLERQYSWTDTLEPSDGLEPRDRRTDWGRGRIDPFNPVKFRYLGMSPKGDNTTGNSDMVPIWNLQPREGMALHWDGLNDTIREVVLSSAIGDGSKKNSIDLAGLQRVENFLRMRKPPRFREFFGEGSINDDLVRKGELVYRSEKCGECHDFGGKRTGTIIPIDEPELRTDPERHKLWGDDAANRYNDFARGYSWKFSHFRGTNGPGGGYASVPLDGVWIRAPFLHNGSVPTLHDLLESPDKRPKVFFRGNDLYDVAKGGYVSDKPADGWRRFTEYDTSLRSNGNGGHTYGTALPEADKKALVEYLKTL